MSRQDRVVGLSQWVVHDPALACGSDRQYRVPLCVACAPIRTSHSEGSVVMRFQLAHSPGLCQRERAQNWREVRTLFATEETLPCVTSLMLGRCCRNAPFKYYPPHRYRCCSAPIHLNGLRTKHAGVLHSCTHILRPAACPKVGGGVDTPNIHHRDRK